MTLPNKLVFTAEDAHAPGIPPMRLRRLLRGGQIVRLRKATYTSSRTYERIAHLPRGDVVLATFAAQNRIAVPTWVTGLSGARLRGLAQPHAAAPTIELLAQPGTATPRRYPELRVQVARVPAAHRDELFGVRCTTTARTITDVARRHPLSTTLIVGDHALRSEAVTSEQLTACLADCDRMTGIVGARTAIAQLSGLRESPLESESFALFIEEGLPLPECQVWIGRDRVDFLWPEAQLVGEADGRQKYACDGGPPEDEHGDVLWREKVRAERLEEQGFWVVRWTYADLLHRHALLVRRLRARLGPWIDTR
ncbi:MAG: hypothetical protein GEU93_10320 [Propionibacteriales bacterium]|nr:hypothetical protein [Propionibacteriales bacterium]